MGKAVIIQPRLPFCRFFNFLLFILFLDFVSSMALWLCGGDTKYMEHNVINFEMIKSVFDLAVLCFVRCVLLVISYSVIEDITLKMSESSYKHMSRKRILYFVVSFTVSAGSFIYCIVKGVLVYKQYLKNKHVMHLTYYILVISSTAFTLLETVLFFVNVIVLRKLRVKYKRMIDEEEGSGTSNGEGEKKKKKVNIARLVSLVKPEVWLIFWGTVALMGSSLANMVAPLYFGLVIDASTKPSMSKLNRTVLELFGIYSAGGIAACFRAWLYTLAGQRLVARLRKELFGHILKQEIAFFDTNRTGELMNRLASDCQVLQNAATVNISMLFRYLLQILGSLVIMFIVSPKLTAVLLAVVPLVAIGAQRYGAYVRDLQKKFQDELANAATSAEETISSLRTVRSFSQEPKSCDQYGESIHKSYLAGSKVAAANGLFNGGFSIIAQGAVVLVLWYGGKLVHDGHMSVGSLTSFMLYTLNVAMAFAFLSSLYGDFMQAVGASIRIFELFDRSPEIQNGTMVLPTLKEAELIFEDVHFTYPSRPDTVVLKELSFSIMPGETVALVGPSGGGKSTIISLIERFYDPVRGTIYIAGERLPDIDTDWFRRKVAIVSQEPVLFASTIAKNIAYGREATQSEIEEAARQANAHSFIENFEDKYETTVGERGVKLSGGQKQRIAIARALLMDPDILLLDEATSALDAESEFLVQEAIDRAMVGRTVLVIAHRLSTVRDASRVIVVDNGVIAEQGTHEELIALNGVYKKLVLRQLTAGDVNSGANSQMSTPEGSPAVHRRLLHVQDANAGGKR